MDASALAAYTLTLDDPLWRTENVTNSDKPSHLFEVFTHLQSLQRTMTSEGARNPHPSDRGRNQG
ncbi:MAG: hypothetical protein AAFY15_15355 [Cyanobacteria bacterium J06648_11]